MFSALYLSFDFFTHLFHLKQTAPSAMTINDSVFNFKCERPVGMPAFRLFSLDCVSSDMLIFRYNTSWGPPKKIKGRATISKT